MDLQQHARLEARCFERGRHAPHRPLDDIGGRALKRRVDRRALRKIAPRGVGVLDGGYMNAAAEERLDIALLARSLLHPLHVIANAGKALEITLDVFGGLALRHAELLPKPESTDAVNDAEIDRLGAAARLGV